MPNRPPGPLKVLFCHFLQRQRQPSPCTAAGELLLLSPLSAWGPLCTHLSVTAVADTVGLRAELISSVTGPGAHPPRHSCFVRHLRALAEKRERVQPPPMPRGGFCGHLKHGEVASWFRRHEPEPGRRASGPAVPLCSEYKLARFPRRSGKRGPTETR